MNNNDLTPPPELVQQWLQTYYETLPNHFVAPSESALHIATQAARWAADQELEACCALMDDWGLDAADLRAARRPVQPSLKEQALEALDKILFQVYSPDAVKGLDPQTATIRAALEQLPDAPAVTPPAYFDNTTDSAIREYLVAWINSLRLRDQGRDAEEGALLEQLDDLWRRIQTAIQPPEAATPDPAPTAEAS